MATIKVTKASSVQSIKNQFSKEFACNIRIYNGIKFADDKMKISDLSKIYHNRPDLKGLDDCNCVETHSKNFYESLDLTLRAKLGFFNLSE